MRELEYLLNSLSKCLTVTLSTQSAYLKTSVLFSIVNYLSSQDKRVDFLDLDLQFSSMLANLKTESALTSFEKMMTYCPKESEVFDSIISLLSQKDLGRGGAIIMDSINSLQDLLRQADNDPDSAKANHRAAIILTIFQELARNNSKLLILSNIVRSRPHMREGEVSWEKELVGGRMIKLKSDVVISISEGQSEEAKFSNKIRLEIVSVSENCDTDLKPGQIIELEYQEQV